MLLLLLWLLIFQRNRLVEYSEHASVWLPVAGLSSRGTRDTRDTRDTRILRGFDAVCQISNKASVMRNGMPAGSEV